MSDFWLGLISGLAANILIILAGILWAWFGAQKYKFRTLFAALRLQRAGVSNVYLDRTEYSTQRKGSISDYISTATQTFSYVGVYFSAATDQSRVDDTLKKLILKGVTVTIALMDPDSDRSLIDHVEDHYGLPKDTLPKTLAHAFDYFKDLRESLAPGDRDRFNIKVHNLPLASSAFIIDEKMPRARILVDNKWYRARRSASLGLEFDGGIADGSLFATVAEAFISARDQAKSA